MDSTALSSLADALDRGDSLSDHKEQLEAVARHWTSRIQNAVVDRTTNVDSFDAADAYAVLCVRAPFDRAALQLVLEPSAPLASNLGNLGRALANERSAHTELIVERCMGLLEHAFEGSAIEDVSIMIGAAELLGRCGSAARHRIHEVARTFDHGIQVGSDHAGLSEVHWALLVTIRELFRGQDPLPDALRSRLVGMAVGHHEVARDDRVRGTVLSPRSRLLAAYAIAVALPEEHEVAASRYAAVAADKNVWPTVRPGDLGGLRWIRGAVGDALVEHVVRQGLGVAEVVELFANATPPAAALRNGLLALAKSKRALFAACCWPLVTRGDMVLLDALLAFSSERSDKTIGVVVAGLMQHRSALSKILGHRAQAYEQLLDRAGQVKKKKVQQDANKLRAGISELGASPLPAWAESCPPSVLPKKKKEAMRVFRPVLHPPSPEREDEATLITRALDTSVVPTLRAAAVSELVPFAAQESAVSDEATRVTLIVDAQAAESTPRWDNLIQTPLRTVAQWSGEAAERVLRRVDEGFVSEDSLGNLLRMNPRFGARRGAVMALARQRLSMAIDELKMLPRRWDTHVVASLRLVASFESTAFKGEEVRTAWAAVVANWLDVPETRRAALEALTMLGPLSATQRVQVLDIALARPSLPTRAAQAELWERQGIREEAAWTQVTALHTALVAIDPSELPVDRVVSTFEALANDAYEDFGKYAFELHSKLQSIARLPSTARDRVAEALRSRGIAS